MEETYVVGKQDPAFFIVSPLLPLVPLLKVCVIVFAYQLTFDMYYSSMSCSMDDDNDMVPSLSFSLI